MTRLALVASGAYDAQRVLFPDAPTGDEVEQPTDEQGVHDDSEVDLDYSDVQWEVPESEADFEQTLAALMATSGQEVVLDEGEGTPWDGTLDFGGDREWT